MKNTYEFGQSQAIESNQVKTLKFKNKIKLQVYETLTLLFIKINCTQKTILIDADLGTVAKTLELKNVIKTDNIQVGIAQNAIGKLRVLLNLE